MISYETSQNMLSLLEVAKTKSEKVFLSQSLGRILACDIVASESSPTQATSAMDGFAIIASDQDEDYNILGDNPAGSDESRVVHHGEAIKTFTGSLMPEGADTLIPIEKVSVDGDRLIINEKVDSGFAVRAIGESYFEGDVLIKKGTKISFAQIGVMAGLNLATVSVVQKPKIAIISTGSEILEVGGERKHAGQIISTNNYTLEALAKEAGADVLQYGVVKDDKQSIMKVFSEAFECADIVVSTGGVSVGDYDFVKDIIPRLGAEVIYKGVNIKPGQHILVAKKENTFVFGLPGFAYSATVTFILYALPIIRRMLLQDSEPNIVEAILKVPFNKRSKKSEFTACNLSVEDGQFYVDFDDKKVGTSAILTNMLGDVALMMTGEEDGNLEANMRVNVIKL